jgi:predicted type IV restriction endonuclease
LPKSGRKNSGMTTPQNDAFSRVLIDKALEFSEWDLLDPKQVQFELHTSNGRADYLLRDKIGRVLCVLEAKREDLDPYDAKEQALGYAENLSAPFIILSNGREHWFWMSAPINAMHTASNDYRHEAT